MPAAAGMTEVVWATALRPSNVTPAKAGVHDWAALLAEETWMTATEAVCTGGAMAQPW